jgi:branched-chain amino acid transport system ATP-binding protein
MIKAMAGLVPSFGGRFRLDGNRCHRNAAACLVRQGLGFVPQTENIFTRLTIEENLQIAAQLLPRPPGNAHRRDARHVPDLGRRPTNWPVRSRAVNARCWPRRAHC